MGELGDKMEGNVKDAGGKVTGNKKMEWEGKAQKAKGDLEKAGNDLKNQNDDLAETPPEPGGNP